MPAVTKDSAAPARPPETRFSSLPRSDTPPAALRAPLARPGPPTASPEIPPPSIAGAAPGTGRTAEPRLAAASRPDLPAAPSPPSSAQQAPRTVAAEVSPSLAAKDAPSLGKAPEGNATSAAARGTAPAETLAGDRLAALRPRSPGGGLGEGRGGIEGEPIPLNTKDPKFNDYFERLRRAIKEKWSYPREAAEKNVGGQLVLEFGIAKDGHLRFVELRRSSGVVVLDDYALNAVKLASPFPRIPDEMSRGGIPVQAVFNYIIEVGSLNNFLR